MKQVLQSRRGTTVVRDVPPPCCRPGDVLVENIYSVISSGTERNAVAGAQQTLIARARARPDLVRTVLTRARRDGVMTTRKSVESKLAEERAIGYSSAGRVLEIGEHVRDLLPGDLVACAGAGHANHAEIVSVPANLCARVPEGVSLRTAALTTIAAIGLHGMRIADVVLGDRVAVIGCGLVGQLLCRMLTTAGAEVVALDLEPRRCEAAVKSGAGYGIAVGHDTVHQVLDATQGIGVDHAIITAASSSNAPLLLGAEIARDRGTLVVVGDVPVDIPRASIYRKELAIRISRSYGPGRYDDSYEERGLDYPIGYVRWTEQRNMQIILALQAHGRLSFDDIVQDIFPVDRAEEAYARLLNPSGLIAIGSER